MKTQPVGLCGVCGNYAYKADEIGNACHAHHHGETCNGVIKDAHRSSDWEACPACTNKGFDQSVDCPQCAGAGWLLMADWSVYILRTRLNSLYTGITTDVTRRLAQHSGQGKLGAKSLRSKGPLELLYQAQVEDRSIASQLEYAIKQLTKAEKEALIRTQPSASKLMKMLGQTKPSIADVEIA